MSAPDFSGMGRDEIVAWFSNAPDSELAEVIRTAQPAEAATAVGPAADTSIPLLLTSIRLPVELVQGLDEVAAAEGINRSEAIRWAVTDFLRDRRGAVTPAEAERALDVLRRLVGEHATGFRDAA